MWTNLLLLLFWPVAFEFIVKQMSLGLPVYTREEMMTIMCEGLCLQRQHCVI